MNNICGKVYGKILNEIEEKKGLVFMQVDPPEIGGDLAKEIAKVGEEAGISAFAVGGSVGAQGPVLEEVIAGLKENSNVPVVLFPGNVATVSPNADAIYFMSMLNSNDPYWITGAQTASSLPLKKMNIEVIPTSYIIIEPGRAVGWIGRAQPIPRNFPYLAGATALAGEYMGSKLIILESGGGAPECAPPEMVKFVREVTDVPLLVAGGVRNEKLAYESTKAGADIIQIGTAIEESQGDVEKAKKTFQKMVDAARKGAKDRK